MFNFSWLEFAAFVFSCVGIVLEKHEKKLFWLFYIIASALFVYEFFIAGLFASSAIQSLYVLIALYGIWTWRRSGVANSPLRIQTMPLKLRLRYFLYSLLIWACLYYVSIRIEDVSPAIDSLILMLALVASYLSCYKYIESWLIFIIVGIVESLLYFSSGLMFTAITCVVMTALDINGLFYWQKVLVKNSAEIAHG